MQYPTPLAAYSIHSRYPVCQIATQDRLLEPYDGLILKADGSIVAPQTVGIKGGAILALLHSSLPHLSATGRVTGGARTRDLRSHKWVVGAPGAVGA
jgi:hypothetical protein